MQGLVDHIRHFIDCMHRNPFNHVIWLSLPTEQKIASVKLILDFGPKQVFITVLLFLYYFNFSIFFTYLILRVVLIDQGLLFSIGESELESTCNNSFLLWWSFFITASPKIFFDELAKVTAEFMIFEILNCLLFYGL